MVSLVPSVTETLLAWGIEPVACTRFCERPALRHVGGTKDPDLDAIVALRPDVVVMDEEENRKEHAAELEAAGIDVHVTAVRALADVGPTLARLAGRVGVPETPLELPDDVPPAGPVAFVPIWKRPWMTISADTYASSLLAAAGVANAWADGPGRYPVVDDLGAVQADVVLAPSEPYPFAERHVPELATVAPVVLLDGRDLFWWGARTPGGLARVRALVACLLA
ncbi:MAG TPA: helical backbone metal receptor [Acidimicrobiales bacterium]|nr:helical backbone metal receptor [Acidimicrobiales bacterium]